MKLQVIKLGKPAQSAYQELVEMFQKRLKPHWKIEEHILKPHITSDRSGAEIFPKLGLSANGERTDPYHYIVVLDERGKQFSSVSLAAWFEHQSLDPQIKQISFVIGGPFGLHPEVRKAANLVWSLAELVFPSDLAWLMLWEQLYRANSILRKASYHHA